jgi:hypothetical protein
MIVESPNSNEKPPTPPPKPKRMENYSGLPESDVSEDEHEWDGLSEDSIHQKPSISTEMEKELPDKPIPTCKISANDKPMDNENQCLPVFADTTAIETKRKPQAIDTNKPKKPRIHIAPTDGEKKTKKSPTDTAAAGKSTQSDDDDFIEKVMASRPNKQVGTSDKTRIKIPKKKMTTSTKTSKKKTPKNCQCKGKCNKACGCRKQGRICTTKCTCMAMCNNNTF